MNLSYAYSPNILPSIIASLILIGLAIYSFRHRQMPGALPFSIACMIGLFWSIGSIFEYSAVDIGLKIFWRKFQVIFQLPSATAITCFLLEYAWPKRWLTWRNLILLSIAPLLIILAIITNPLHYLFWEGFGYDGGLVAIAGPLMKYFIYYVFFNFLINLIVLIWLFIHSSENRWPVAIMAIGQITMRIFYFIDFVDQAVTHLPFSAVGIAITSLLYAIVFFRFQILGPIPLARQVVIEQLPMGMLVLDHQQVIRSLNPAAESMLGITNRAAKGIDITAVLPTYIGGDFDAAEEKPLEFSLNLNGERRYYLLDIEILKDWRELGVGQLLLITDVTEQKKAQARILEQGRVLATMKEREQLARELHDDLAQVFAFINTQGQTIQRVLNRGDLDTADRYLSRLVEAAREGEADIRESIRGMRLTLSEYGLLASLEKYAAVFEANTAIKTKIVKSDEFDVTLINPMVEVHLLRILQEALNNIRKHANASQVWIRFDLADSSICITVQDDGQGFDIDKGGLESTQHYGLKMMRERAREIEGTIDLSSQSGQGTAVRVCVPLDKNRMRDDN
jgi:signal transduction histidine kinase